MSTRLGVAADEPRCLTIYNAAVTHPTEGIALWWPGGASVAEPNVVTHWRTSMTLRVSFSGSTIRGFTVTRQHGIDGTESAEELFLWILDPSLSAANKKAATKELILAWWNDCAARGVTWAWGLAVPVYPAGTEIVMTQFAARGLVFGTKTVSGFQWRLLKVSPADGVTKLTGW